MCGRNDERDIAATLWTQSRALSVRPPSLLINKNGDTKKSPAPENVRLGGSVVVQPFHHPFQEWLALGGLSRQFERLFLTKSTGLGSISRMSGHCSENCRESPPVCVCQGAPVGRIILSIIVPDTGRNILTQMAKSPYEPEGREFESPGRSNLPLVSFTRLSPINLHDSL
jgi:hypothetical protein